MAQPKQIPELANELFEVSKEYLLQETVEPAKKLGKYAGLGIGGAILLAVAAVLLVLGLYALLQTVFGELGDSAWWNVLARGATFVVAAVAAGIIAWRISA